MKILVISLAGIGDTLFATPLIHELRENFPAAQIDAFVLWKGSQSVLSSNPHLNCVFQKNLIADDKPGSLGFLLGLRGESYDVSLNTHPQSRSHYRLVSRLIGARKRASHSYHTPRWLDRLLVNRIIPQDYTRHAIENNLALLPLIGATPHLAKHDYEIFLTAAEHEWAESFLSRQKLTARPWLAVHVGSGGTKNLALRRWPLDHYIQLFARLRQTHPDLAVVLVGGPEEEKDHDKILAAAVSQAIYSAHSPGLREAAALVKRCRAFLSVDTALMHVAAAMKVPRQIVIETPTWNKPIEPYGGRFTLVRNPAIAGRNLEYYRYDGRGIRGTAGELRACMASVSVDAVWGVVNDVLPETTE